MTGQPFDWLLDYWPQWIGATVLILTAYKVGNKMGEKSKEVDADIATLKRDVKELQAETERLNANQLKVLKAFPRKMLEGEIAMMSADVCNSLRESCSLHVASEKYDTELKVMRHGIVLLITYNPAIPEMERNKILADLQG